MMQRESRSSWSDHVKQTSKKVENWSILIAKLCILAQEKNEAAFKRVKQKIVKTFLEDIIVEKVNQYIGYSLNDITTEEFLQATRSILYNYTMQQTRLIKSDAYAGLKISDSNKITAINQFWQIVESNVLVSKSFQNLFDRFCFS